MTNTDGQYVSGMVDGISPPCLEAKMLVRGEPSPPLSPIGIRYGRPRQRKQRVIVLIHWRIRPEQEHIDSFLAFWRTKATVESREGLIGEFLSETLSQTELPYITWHMDPDRLNDHKSFVNVAAWSDEKAFHEQIGKHFNDDKPLLPFEKYRRLRIVLRPKCWRMGNGKLPVHDSSKVL